jgi:hypothetical protein
MLNIVMVSVIILNVVMLSAIILSVVVSLRSQTSKHVYFLEMNHTNKNNKLALLYFNLEINQDWRQGQRQ